MEKPKPKVLSGYSIVAKGITKLDASLPEIGLKDVTPNGSWLEQKQIQSALESRKHLIEVERIEKFGTLSHAIWRDDLQLAEVTQKTGGHWQYLGHNVGKTLYLRPEETLFLMEINCLLLKHNDITMSLQKAYSLLLKEFTITQYKVYASLSRLGYKILRHKLPKAVLEQRCHSPEKHTEDSNQNFIVQNTNLKDGVDKLPELSLSISKSNNNYTSIITTENIGQTILFPDKNNSDEANVTHKNTPVTENEKNKPAINKTNDSSEIQTPIHESTTSVVIHKSKDTEVNTNENNVEKGTEPSENIDTKMQNELKIDVCASFSSVSKNPNITMDIDIPNLKTENNDTPHIANIKSESQSDITVVITSAVNEIDKGITEDLKKPNTTSTNEITQESKITNSHMENPESTSTSIGFRLHNDSIKSVEGNCPDLHGLLTIEVDSMDSDIVMDLDTPTSQGSSCGKIARKINNDNTDRDITEQTTKKEHNDVLLKYVTIMKKLIDQRINPSNYKTIAKHFEIIPELTKKELVTINAPDQHYIPRNIFVNNTSYVLNIKEITTKHFRSLSVHSPMYNSANGVNSNQIRIRSNSSTEFNQNPHLINNIRFPRQPLYFRPFNFWRPQNNSNYLSFNMFLQRPSFPNMFLQRPFLHSLFQNQPRLLQMFSHPNNVNTNSSNPNANSNNRKRLRTARDTHLQRIKNLAFRLKQHIMSGNTHKQNIESLHKLLTAYNNRYKARLRLNKNFEVVSDEKIVETIELDVDNDSKAKRPRLSEDSDDKFNEYFNKLRQLASKLKDLETKNESAPKHKRALSKAIKTFNESYDADIYLNKDYELIDKRFITIDSDNESDCVVKEPEVVPKGKKLRNPFYILKQLSEKQVECLPSTSKDYNTEEFNINSIEHRASKKYQQHITSTFSENWLPQENDFGRAEVIKKSVINPHFIFNDEYLYIFIKNHREDINDWAEAKMAFLQHIQDTSAAFKSEHDEMLIARETMSQTGLQPLLNAGDSLDTPAVLEKLKIIKNNTAIITETNLSIHFDVYNRDVQNFRKTNPPKPHFRIVCVEKSSNFPSASDVMALHSKYKDNVPVVFAIVCISSISYLQIKPIDLPIYVSNNDLG